MSYYRWTSQNCVNYAQTVFIPISSNMCFAGVMYILFVLNFWLFLIIVVVLPFPLRLILLTS